MSELTLSRDERLRLKSGSHHLEPVVLLGAHGLTEAVFKEIDRALTAHELVKVRMPALDRAQRELMFQQVAEGLGAARIQLIGRLMVLFRPAPKDPRPRARVPTPQPKARRPAVPLVARSGARAPMPKAKRPAVPLAARSGARAPMPKAKRPAVPLAARSGARVPMLKAKRPPVRPAPRSGDRIGRDARAPFPARRKRPGAAPLPHNGKRTASPRRRPTQT
jgi:RNA-binding protein